MSKQQRLIAGALVLVAILLVIGGSWRRGEDSVSAPAPTFSTRPTAVLSPTGGTQAGIITVAENLTVPWEIVFLPDGVMLVTERDGTVKRVKPDGKTIVVAGVAHVGEGGLLGMALHPDFADNRYLYLYLTTREGGGLTNRVERYRFENDTLSERKVVLDRIPGANNHDGGRIAYGPDGKLYVATGDAERPANAQDRGSLAGKILRLNDDGSIPEDNPFGNATYSYGHRNVQGLAWDGQGRLWATEHGRSVPLSGYDELNLIKKGANYGWPTIQGDGLQAGMRGSAAHSGPKDTWAPAGLAFVGDKAYFAGLRGEALYEATIGADGKAAVRKLFTGRWGRLRAVTVAPDGALYLSTSNTDGRGKKRAGDDRIIRVPLAELR